MDKQTKKAIERINHYQNKINNFWNIEVKEVQ